MTVQAPVNSADWRKMKDNRKKSEKSCELCIRDEYNNIVAWQVGMSEADIEDMLKRHVGWRRSSEYI